MPQPMVHLIATLKAKPGRSDELRSLLTALIEPTRAEPGCLMYELWHSKDDENVFKFVEKWSSQEALRAHFDTPHIKSALSRLPDLLAADLDLRHHELVG